MKFNLSIFIMLCISFSLNASQEFTLLEPYAVEKAPLALKVEPTPILKVAPVEKKIVKTQQDDDNDGVFNDKDQCPDTSSEFMVDGYGCPQTMILHINFADQKANISEKDIKNLQTFAQFLKDNSEYQVIIYGHTDNVGDENYNQKLSKQRADAVKEILVRYDIDAYRLTAIGKGEQEPVADNETSQGRAENRRIEIELIQ